MYRFKKCICTMCEHVFIQIVCTTSTRYLVFLSSPVERIVTSAQCKIINGCHLPSHSIVLHSELSGATTQERLTPLSPLSDRRRKREEEEAGSGWLCFRWKELNLIDKKIKKTRKKEKENKTWLAHISGKDFAFW